MKAVTASFDGLRVRPLGLDDLLGALALSAEAGWNQTAEDWRLLIAGGRSLGVEAPDGRLIASALAYVYDERIAWIAMVLVTPAWRRRGIATELMRRVVADCREAGFVTGLDATPAGREVYLPLGFRDIYAFSRLEAAVVDAPRLPKGIRRLEAGDVARVIAYDRTVSGMARGPLIESLRRRRPRHAFLAERGGAVAGIALAREGRRAHQLGPLLADDEATALALARAALADVDGPVFIDLLDDKRGLRELLEVAGFRPQRGYIRMLLDRDEALDDRDRVWAVAGPEFG